MCRGTGGDRARYVNGVMLASLGMLHATVKGMTKRMSLKEFCDEGFLQELNRQFLHPLGMALEVLCDDDGTPVLFGGIWDYRNDPEGIVYADDSGLPHPAKAARVAALAARKHDDRRALLGFVVQPVPVNPDAKKSTDEG